MSYPQQNMPAGPQGYSQQQLPQYQQQYQYQQGPYMPKPVTLLANQIIGAAILVLGVFLTIGARLPFLVVRPEAEESSGIDAQADFSVNVFQIFTAMPEIEGEKPFNTALAILATLATVLSFAAVFLAGAWLLRGTKRLTGALLAGVSGIAFFVVGLASMIIISAHLDDVKEGLGDNLGSVTRNLDGVDVGTGAGCWFFIIGGVFLLAAAVCAVIFGKQIPQTIAKPKLTLALESLVAGSFLLLALPWYTVTVGAEDDKLSMWCTGLSRLPSIHLEVMSISFSLGSSLSLALNLLAITLAVLLAAHALASSTSMRQLRWVVAGAGILAATCGLWSLISTISYRSKILDIPEQLGKIMGSSSKGMIPEIDEYFKLGVGPWLYFIAVLAIAVLAVLPLVIKSPQEKWEAYNRKMAQPQMAYPAAGQPTAQGMQQVPYGSNYPQGQNMPYANQTMQQQTPPQPADQAPNYWQP